MVRSRWSVFHIQGRTDKTKDDLKSQPNNNTAPRPGRQTPNTPGDIGYHGRNNASTTFMAMRRPTNPLTMPNFWQTAPGSPKHKTPMGNMTHIRVAAMSCDTP